MTNKVDLSEPLKNCLRKYFKKYGVDFYDPEADPASYSPKLKGWLRKNRRNAEQDKKDVTHLLTRQYVNFARKFIRIGPLNVKFSSKVRSIQPHHPERKVINLLSEKFRAGENLNPFLSKGLLQAYDEDQFYSTMKMFHLHFNLKRTKHHYFMDRSDKLLMVFIHEDTAYFLDVRNHKEADEKTGVNLVWSRQEFIHILAKEFPEVIKHYKLNGILPPKKDEAPSDFELDTLKRKGYNPMFSSEGMVLIPMGGGIASDGSSMEVTMHTHQLRQMIFEWEKHLSDRHDDLIKDFESHGLVVTDFSFSLSHEEGGLFVYDEKTGARLVGMDERSHFSRRSR